MHKKAQSMSLNTIVVAALVVLVLVILSVIFMGRMGVTTQNLNECKGECMDDRCEDGFNKIPGSCYGSDGKPDKYQVCCVELDI